jgi:homopolymeric O-antigen transport system permease protein
MAVDARTSGGDASPVNDALLWRHRTAAGVVVGDGEARPARLGLVGLVRELVESRNALRVFIVSQFRATHRAQALGVFWPIANPLLLTLVLSIVFGRVFPSDVRGYPVFLLLGLVLWNFVSHAWTDATRAFVDHASLLKHTEIPPHVVVVGTVLANAIALGFGSLSLLPLLAFYPESFHLSAALLVLPVVVALVILLTIALGLVTSVLHVLYRDVAYVVDSILLVFFWLTPIIYPLDRLSHGVRRAVLLNPLAAFLCNVRDIVIGGRFPPWSVFGWGAASTVGLTLVSAWLYRRHAHFVADHV